MSLPRTEEEYLFEKRWTLAMMLDPEHGGVAQLTGPATRKLKHRNRARSTSPAARVRAIGDSESSVAHVIQSRAAKFAARMTDI